MYKKLKRFFVFFGFNTLFCFFFFVLVIFFCVALTLPSLLMLSCVILILIFPELGIFSGDNFGLPFASVSFIPGRNGMAKLSLFRIHSISIVLLVNVRLKVLSMVIFSSTFSVCAHLLEEQEENINTRNIMIICFMVL